LAVDQRSDIYSLGVVLYEAVTGRPPFGTDNPMAVILRHINEPITSPRTLRSDLPKEIECIILKMLAKSPHDRYQRMEEFLSDVREAYPLSDNHLVHQGNRRVGSSEIPAARGSASTSKVTPILSGERTFPWVGFVIGVVLLLTLALTLAFMDFSTLTDVVATEPSPSPALSPSAMPSPSPTPSPPAATLAPTAAPTVSLLPTRVQVWEADGAEMVFVPAGEFIMGSEELGDDERPVHLVYLDDFWIDRYEVTNERFARFVAETGYQTEAEKLGWGWVSTGSEKVEGADWRHPRGPGSSIEGKMDHPVVLVSWNDADAYCRWAGKRLPSEAQWEKAARGPSTGPEPERRYAWGNEFDSAKTNTKESGRGDTTPVGNFSPQGDSPYGASDVTGNVWEWVADWYGSDYYGQTPPANPPGIFYEVFARTAFRYNVKPDYTYNFTGFRCSSQ
jgi:formylglycine-generating enzyme required for sulfatase activity